MIFNEHRTMKTKKLTTEQLAKKVVEAVEQMTPDEKAKLRARLRREFGKLHIKTTDGYAAAAAQCAEEWRQEQLFLNFDPKAKPVN
jgi:hypothetical protein